MNPAAAQGPRPTGGNAVEFLIDNEDAWGRLAEAVGSARESVRCLLFMLDLPHVRMGFGGPVEGRRGAPGSVRLEERLAQAAANGAEVSVLLNHVLPAWSPANTSRQVERYFKRCGAQVRTRRLRTPQAVPVHAKLFVVDGRTAFSIGSIFAQEYFDGTGHLVDDPRRGHLRWRSSVLAPTHDVSAVVRGPAVADLDAAFGLHWAHAGPADLPPAEPPEPAGTLQVQVTRTLHGARYRGLPQGETGIFESYRRALERAGDFVYLENQYLTSVEVADAVAAALRGNEALQVIALLNSRPDIPGYPRWQRDALHRLFRKAGDAAERLGVFTAWSHQGRSVIRTHIHSKVAVADDAWATVGSANLDGLSQLASEHQARASWPMRLGGRLIGAFGSGADGDARATEVNLSIADFDGTGAATTGAQIAALRRRLWAEHLGLGAEELRERPAGGWLALWRERAEAKRRMLVEAPDRPVPCRVLPFPGDAGGFPDGTQDSAVYLRELGIDPASLDLRKRLRSFSFTAGAWQN
ncbi:phosphatidylserine/phosphatidylglycerophosphate/cardiolipin synthase family protein [Glycomyces mayteni]|uniref:Phosphatidylserine/phosphatidylglycerophosphate/ cardiolipin synthase family protein n=1 Tax=Glycomyces mayteni TaxID=543887 RepID=A0ABW2D4B0_9ACTN